MQYLKDEVRNKILQEALKEFREKGYQGASIRNIAKNSNTSIGNIYKYFSSKESLYQSLIEPVYNQLMDYIPQFEKVEHNEKTEDIFYQLMEKIMEIFNTNNKELSILLNKSEGSRYENCKKSFVDFITRTVTDAMEYQLSLQHKKLEDNFIIYLLSYNLVESIAIILKEKDNGLEVRNLILELINIMFFDIADKLSSKSI
ncbi:MAG: TetR/AcrR family transcriptional regulator [Bacillota bacterium]|nr:TetR/AcrR family transcriptional regulator [Bacillota bacterium]